MNERIQELAVAAGMYVDLNGTPWPRAMSAEECEAAYKKFAELIVQECAKVIDDGRFSVMECEGNSHRVSYNNGIYYALSSVKKHFGVAE